MNRGGIIDPLSLQQHPHLLKMKEVTLCKVWQAGKLWNTCHTEIVDGEGALSSWRDQSARLHFSLGLHHTFSIDAVQCQCNNAS